MFTSDEAAIAALDSDEQMIYTLLSFYTSATTLTAMFYTKAHYANVTVPVLALHGDAGEYYSEDSDGSAKPSGTEEMIKVISSEDKQFILQEGVRHSALDDVESNETIALITDWLNERSNAR